MILDIFPPNTMICNGETLPCVLGKSGVTKNKCEGDNATPVGLWPMRKAFYRPDRLQKPETSLVTRAITPKDGWCVDPKQPLYNKHIYKPFNGGYEDLWRHDEVYDLIIVLGFNDAPVVPGMGSAIFMHVARFDLSETEGCIALELPNLQSVIKDCSNDSFVNVHPAP
mgnify:CR=1 FL=1